MDEDLAAQVIVTKGNPTDEELGAAVTVAMALLARSVPTARPNDDRAIAGGWKSYWRVVRRPFVSGPEAWRGSLR